MRFLIFLLFFFLLLLSIDFCPFSIFEKEKNQELCRKLSHSKIAQCRFFLKLALFLPPLSILNFYFIIFLKIIFSQAEKERIGLVKCKFGDKAVRFEFFGDKKQQP